MAATGRNPLAIFTRPSSKETRTKRVLHAEKEARQKSNAIDEQLKRERAAMIKQKGLVRVLLLGQSESGKSTFLKNFLMMYSFPQWEAERLSRRAVIQLKLVCLVLTILDIIEAEMNRTPSIPTSIVPEDQFSADEYDEEGNPTDEEEDSLTDEEEDNPIPCGTASGVGVTNISRRSSLPSKRNSNLRTALSNQHQTLKLRLGPLRGVEVGLRRRLDARKAERSDVGVKWLPEALENGVQALALDGSDHGQGAGNLEAFSFDEATDIIASCKDDMKALWTDEFVRNILAKRKVRLEDGAVCFLDDIDRIATRTYEPLDDDFVRARPPTPSVQEYNIQFEWSEESTPSAGDFGKEQWLMYDVGGSRTMRNTWLPFFENVNAIIFFASLSCFDEQLEEDRKINRLEDSVSLWRSVCSSKLLAKTALVLLLTKCDILERKLNSGIMVKKYIPSYGERPNDAESVIKYLREKFRGIFKAQFALSRPYYCIVTSVTDKNGIANMLKAVRNSVQDSITREHLKTTELM